MGMKHSLFVTFSLYPSRRLLFKASGSAAKEIDDPFELRYDLQKVLVVAWLTLAVVWAIPEGMHP